MNRESNYLPTLVLIKIFSYLKKADRLRASSTCKSWRNCIFNKTLWPLTSITINLIEISCRGHFEKKRRKNKIIFKNFLSKCCAFIEELTIIFDPYSYSDIKLIIEILQLFKEENEKEKRMKEKQNCLKKIYLKPTTIRLLNNMDYHQQGYNMAKLFDAIEDTLIARSSLVDISFGLLEELLNRIPSLLHSLAQNDNYCNSLQSLHISTVKEDPDYYAVYDFSPFLLQPFSNLKIISIDYDYICDELISILASKPLENLIINVHGLDDEHPGVSDSTWNLIKSKINPPQVTLNLLHTDDCSDLREKILNSNIPITHFRAFFLGFNDCQGIGIVDIVNLIALRHHNTLKSLSLVDRFKPFTSLPNTAFSQTAENALVMLSWRCKILSHLTIIGKQQLVNKTLTLLHLAL